MGPQGSSPRGFEVFDVGQTVNVLNMTMSGRYILEGQARVLEVVERPQRHALVRFVGARVDLGDPDVERYIDPRAQGSADQVEAWLELLNRRNPPMASADVEAFDAVFDLDATVPGGPEKEGG